MPKPGPEFLIEPPKAASRNQSRRALPLRRDWVFDPGPQELKNRNSKVSLIADLGVGAEHRGRFPPKRRPLARGPHDGRPSRKLVDTVESFCPLSLGHVQIDTCPARIHGSISPVGCHGKRAPSGRVHGCWRWIVSVFLEMSCNAPHGFGRRLHKASDSRNRR